MIHWNVHVKYESELQSATYSADCSADCRSDMFIPVYQTNGRSINNTIGVVMNLLVGMGLKTHILAFNMCVASTGDVCSICTLQN